MLTIRAAQMEALLQYERTKFPKRIAEYLLEVHPDLEVALPANARLRLRDIPEQVLLSMVQGGMTRAESYGLTWQSNLTAFVVLMFNAAPNFDAHPIVRQVLSDPRTDPDFRIDLLWERTSDAIWDSVVEAYNPTYWLLPEQHDEQL